MRREMMWAGENRNREGLAHSEGMGSDVQGHLCLGTWCASLEKASKLSWFYHEPGVLMWVLIVTFILAEVPMLCSLANDANCHRARGGPVLYLHEEPHQTPKGLGPILSLISYPPSQP